MYEIFERLLKEKGITANTVGKATGITSATFSSWKKGVYTPKREKMQKIAEYLGVSVAYLMGATDIPNEDLTLEEAQKRLEESQNQIAIFERKIKELETENERIRALIEYAEKIQDMYNDIHNLTPEQKATVVMLLQQFKKLNI